MIEYVTVHGQVGRLAKQDFTFLAEGNLQNIKDRCGPLRAYRDPRRLDWTNSSHFSSPWLCYSTTHFRPLGKSSTSGMIHSTPLGQYRPFREPQVSRTEGVWKRGTDRCWFKDTTMHTNAHLEREWQGRQILRGLVWYLQSHLLDSWKQ